MKPIYITASARTPLGSFQGSLSSLSAPELGAASIRASLGRSACSPEFIDNVFFGNVVSAGLGQAPARQAALRAGLPVSVPCTTVNKVCGSGMQAIILAANAIQCGQAHRVIAGGMESMSNTPYLLDKARQGYRLGHHTTKDTLFLDGLEDAETGRLMGAFAQHTADCLDITRKAMDDYALESLKRAQAANIRGLFKAEITPLTVTSNKGEILVDLDEQITRAKPENIRKLKPAFKNDGTVTPANSSSISDGAASLLVFDEEALSVSALKPEAQLVGHASHAQRPEEFVLAPIGAIKKVLKATGWSVNDVDLFEINEAFAVVAIQAMSELGLDHNKVNVHGGACALGHPLGASGARIIVTLIHALKSKGKTKGIASLCIGGGEATAIAIELT